MKVLAIVGSPRKNGNTDMLINQIIAGIQPNPSEFQKIYLYSYSILPCVDCRQCKKGNLLCPIKDDMPKLNVLLEQTDLLIFGTPIYWYGPTAKMKLFVDRFRPFIVNKKLAGKKGIVVIPSEEGPSICEPTIKMFEMSFQYLGIQMLGSFLTSAYEKGEIAQNKTEMDRAYDFGKNLAENN